ncbi:enoyl-CoA hydratase-related protein [Mycobacterium sp. NPDC006124]|uniref:enoyl-CoA hydratase/isomerase family protein n=1 Tax=Mycobacterium sp. NPDC006124 TaxID=3156729 RepID=UPI0033AC09A2
MSTKIAIRVDGAVARLELDGADRLNAIGTQTYTDLAAAIRTLESQTSVRAVIVHGSGRVFCAGADIAEIQTFSGREAFAAFLRGFTDALDVLVASPLPVIAAIHGSALGGGLELAMACDLRVATPDATLGLPEAKLGVLPGAGGTQRLPRLIPVGVSTEMLMLGNVIDGERAHALGLVNRLSCTDTLLETAGGIAEQLATGAARVASVTKSLLQQTRHLSTAEGIQYERNAVADLFDTADGREGFRAFTERRAPTFDER